MTVCVSVSFSPLHSFYKVSNPFGASWQSGVKVKCQLSVIYRDGYGFLPE